MKLIIVKLINALSLVVSAAFVMFSSLAATPASGKDSNDVAYRSQRLAISPGDTQAHARQADTEWSPETSVAVRYVTGDNMLPATWRPVQGTIYWSPNRTRFFFITRRGDIACDCNNYDLYVYSVQDVQAQIQAGATRAKPLLTQTYHSDPLDADSRGISLATWVDDQTISYVDVQTKRAALKRLDAATGKITDLSSPSDNVFWVTPIARPTSALYMTEDEGPIQARPGYPGLEIPDIADPTDLQDYFSRQNRKMAVYAEWNGERRRLVSYTGYIPEARFWLSPNGETAIVETPESGPRAADGTMRRRPVLKMSIYDLKTGASKALDGLPADFLPEAGRGFNSEYKDVLFSADRKSLLVGLETRRNSPDIPTDFRLYDCAIVLANCKQVALPEPTDPAFVSMRWVHSGRELEIIRTSYGNKAPQSLKVTRKGGGWSAQRYVNATAQSATDASPHERVGALSVVIDEDQNRPPIPFAEWKGKRIALLDADEALVNRDIIQQKTFRWKVGAKPVEGGLLLPKRLAGQTAPPLVIQAYDYDPKRFMPDGPSPTGYAARSLVNAGIAVLTVNIPGKDGSIVNTPAETSAFQDLLASARDALAAEGLVDGSRVGAVGFSRAGFELYHAITHPKQIQLQAAVIAEGGTYNFGEYLTTWQWSLSRSPFEPYYGGSFWAQKQRWLDDAPSFNIDRVQTPVMFQNGRGHVHNEQIGAFRLNNKPMKYIYFPEAVHQFSRPSERLASMKATTDWFVEWLKPGR